MKAADRLTVFSMIIRHFEGQVRYMGGYTLCLFSFRANLAVHLALSSLNHSYSYASTDDCATCCAIFTLKPNPSCNMRANPVTIQPELLKK